MYYKSIGNIFEVHISVIPKSQVEKKCESCERDTGWYLSWQIIALVLADMAEINTSSNKRPVAILPRLQYENKTVF